MNNTQMAMAGMPNAGGPVGGMAMTGLRSGVALSQLTSLNTYIYDYLIRQGFHDVARAMLKAHRISEASMPLQLSNDRSPSGRDANGVDGTDSKDDVKRPADLPEPGNHIGSAESCFLEDWWCQFWDVHNGLKGNGNSAMQQYITQNRQQMMLRQQRQNELVNQHNVNNMYNRMSNGMNPNDMRQAAMMANAKGVPFNAAMMNPQMRLKMEQMRQGQNANMGEQRSQSPNGNGDAPSPKRQRMDGTFNGQAMGPAGRGQGMPGQPGMAGPNQMMLQNSMPESFQAQMNQMKMGDVSSPMGQGQPGDGGNHALQDYQMQLMLLEQQNKKRLLMARQEQDSLGPNQQAQMGPFIGGTGMSPQNSRQGPSPNPQDQMKRGTPQMGQKGLPPGNSPAGMEAMQGNRGSPAPGFDPNNMPPGMQGQFFPGNPQMAGQMGRPPSSHPGPFQIPPGMTPQQADFVRQQHAQAAAARGQPFPGMMPGQTGQQVGQQPGQPGQQAPQAMGTPRQPQGAMPPPPAPATQAEQKTNPSSPNPSGQAAPPTPNPTKGSLPKGGKKEKAAPNKKVNNKKNPQNAGATPASEAAEPPTPSTPITPMHANSFKNGVQQQQGAGTGPNANANGPTAAGAGANAPNAGAAVPGPQNPTPQGSGSVDGSGQYDIGGMDVNGINLEIADFGSGDVLENFDFDTFLHNTDDNAFGDFNMEDFGTSGLLADG